MSGGRNSKRRYLAPCEEFSGAEQAGRAALAEPSVSAGLPRIIVCEKSGDWAAVVRNAAKDGPLDLSETRAYPACLRELDRERGRVALLELRQERLREGLETLAAIARRFPRVTVFVVAARELRPLEWAVRELGAADFVTSQRDPAPLVAALRRAAERKNGV